MAFCCCSPHFFSNVCSQLPQTAPSASSVWAHQLCAGWVCVLWGSTSEHSAEISNVQSAICRVQYAVFSFPSSPFFFFNFPVRTLYHTNYRKYPRDTFGLRNLLFPILRLSHLLDVSVYLSTLSIMKKEKDEHFLSFQDKSELKEVNLEAMQSLACSCRIWKFVRISFDFQ